MPLQTLVVTLHERHVALEVLAAYMCDFEMALALVHRGSESSIGYEQTLRALLLCYEPLEHARCQMLC